MAFAKLWRLASAAVAVLGVSIDSVAQSCAMCYTSAAATKGAGIRALQHGILILLIPPLLTFIGICAAAFRRRSHDPTALRNIPASRDNE